MYSTSFSCISYQRLNITPRQSKLFVNKKPNTSEQDNTTHPIISEHRTHLSSLSSACHQPYTYDTVAILPSRDHNR